MSIDFVILAAGLGSRMKSSTPKFFQKVAGKPIISYIIESCKSQNPSNIITVTSEKLKGHELLSQTKTVVQNEPNGTAHAVIQAIPYLNSEYTIITCGDMPLIENRHFELLSKNENEVSLISMEIPDELMDMPYGRVVLNNGNFDKIVEYKNANQEEKQIKLANTGIYKIKTELLKKYITKIKKNELSGEFYLTDLLEIMKKSNIEISVINSKEYWEFHGINTMEDLAKAEAIMQKKLRNKFMNAGVKLLDPDSVYFSCDTEIENDVIIEQNVVIGGGAKIKSGSVIRAFSYISDCEIMNNVEIGPFARIRGNAKFFDNSSIGNFVEVKGATIGFNSKAKHLAYIGDSAVGENSNIGAGTITCNYDGVKKHKTTIGNNVFIGSNSTLISPVEIEDDSIIGAGSVINKTVHKNGLAIARSKQVEFPDGATQIWDKKGKLKK